MTVTSTDLRFDTGRICLDLLATVGGNLSRNPVERLDSADRLAVWLRESGVVPEDQPLSLDTAALEEFRMLRACLHRVIHRVIAGELAAAHDIERLNGVAAVGAPPARLVQSGTGELRRQLVATPRVEQLLAAVSDDAIHLLSSPDRVSLRECEGPVCDLVYVDASRGRRRRWCSAATCGNRHHVAAYRARKVSSR